MRASTRRTRRTARVEYTLPRQASSARWARQLTTGFLAGAHTPPQAARCVDEANLVVSELVTNATRYGLGRPRLRLSTANSTITVEVRDESVSRPVLRRPGADHESGRGFVLVRGLARHLNVTSAPGGGKTVRAVLDAA